LYICHHCCPLSPLSFRERERERERERVMERVRGLEKLKHCSFSA
jgi:hypothetical protein